MKKHFPAIIIGIGCACLLVGLGVLILTYYPVAYNELSYVFFRPSATARVVVKEAHPQKGDIVPVDDQFGIVIPKIKANSKIIANVDPFNEKEYQWALTKGVAQAKGSSLP